MKRRDLFKFAGLGATALLVSTTTFFLPPKCGWGAQRLKIRVVQQYCINTDCEPWRYDAAWIRPNGEHVQFHYGPLRPLPFRDDVAARYELERRMRLDGGEPNSDQFRLALPRGIMVAEYI